MKCLHILPMNKLSGAEKLALILCKNMQRYQPIVVCGGDNLKNIFEDNSIKAYSVDFKNNNLLQNVKELNKIIKENNIKLVHAHDNNASISGYITKLLYRGKFKLISHIHNCYPWLQGKNKNKIIDSIVRKRYDHNIACGKLVYDYYIENTDYIDSNNTTILSNAIDIDEIRNTTKTKEALKSKYNIGLDKKIIGFIGRISEQKGIIPFIEEFKNHKEDFKDCKFLIIGSGDQDNEVKELIKKYELENYFILTGHEDNVYKFYPIIDIFFLPSLYEGLPMVILEAMSFKKPIVSMDVGSINEVVKNEYNGYLINKNDYTEFINSLKTLKNSNQKIQSYGQNSFKTINENYNIVYYQKSITKVYDKVLSLNTN
ncbi:MAG: glycosyltransferase [Paraclostridium sp.]